MRQKLPGERALPSVVLAGASLEALALCRQLGHDVLAVSDPAELDGDVWQGLVTYSDDRAASRHRGIEGVVIAIDLPMPRQRVQDAFHALGIPIVDVIGGRLGAGVVHGPGLFMQALSNLSEGSEVGQGLRMNVGANVMHDARIGDFVTVAPGATVLGRVTIGDGVYVGGGATVLPDLSIGSGAVIGAGAVVTRSVAAGAVVTGVPARG